MKKIILHIVLVVALAGSLFAQESYVLFQVDHPETVPVGIDFQSGVTLKILDEFVDSVKLGIVCPKDIKLDSAIIALPERVKLKLSIFEESVYDGKHYTVNLNKKDSTLFGYRSIQLNLYYQNDGVDDEEFVYLFPEYSSPIKYDNEVIDQFSKNKLVKNSNIYVPTRRSDNCLILEKESYFNLVFEDISFNNLMTEFWIKTEVLNTPFVSFLNEKSQDTLLTLKLNPNRIVVPDFKNGFEYYNDVFLSKDVWHHIVIFFDEENNKMKVYCNDKLFFVKALSPNFGQDELVFSLLNNSTVEASTYIDRLKAWNFGNTISKTFSNKYYNYYLADSSKQIVAFDFSEVATISGEGGSYLLETFNIKFTDSDAPIFSKAPDLDVEIYIGYLSITWKVKDGSVAESFIIEKSFDGKKFNSVYQTSYVEGQDVYNYSDSRETRSEVLYYRVIQLNNDGSQISSSTTKLGHRNLEQFIVGQNYPNPFNPYTTIRFEVLEQCEVELNVYDVVGNKIATLHSGVLGKGEYDFDFDGSELPSGIYFYEVKSPFSSTVQKMILTK